MLAPDALRLTAALVHTLPTVQAVVRPDHGPELVVGTDWRYHPDLSPCELRRLVAAQRSGDGPELSWLTSVEAVELGGSDVTGVFEDVVRVGAHGTGVLAFATLLDPCATRAAAARRRRTTLRDGGLVDATMLHGLRASTFHDEVLDVTTVVVGEPAEAPASGVAALDVVLASARACRVGELLASVTARPLSGRAPVTPRVAVRGDRVVGPPWPPMPRPPPRPLAPEVPGRRGSWCWWVGAGTGSSTGAVSRRWAATWP